ncbi:Hsp70 family protein [Patescibacteria group bacterium]|nr:Hsp70 family protein [Patescibacteria group bacterium]
MKVGLDFGTTNSSISVVQNGQAVVLPIDQLATDPRVVRSMLFFYRRNLVYNKKMPKMRQITQVFKTEDIQWEGQFRTLVGQMAVQEYLQENTNRHPGIRRRIFTGRWIRMRDMVEARTVAEPEWFEEVDYGTGRLLQALKSALRTSYKGTTIFGKFFTVEELVALFISDIKQIAQKQLGENIEEMVIGRPVYFSEDPLIDQKAQSRLAVAIRHAGIKKLKFEFEPVAAARQFATTNKQEQIVFIFDFGGGTLDTAIIKTGANFQVLASDGVYIGGDLLNADIMQAKLWDYFGCKTRWGDFQLEMPIHLYHSLQSWYSIPNLNNPDTMNLLDRVTYKNTDPQAIIRLTHLIKSNLGFEIYEAIEQAKKELSEKDQSVIVFHNGPIDLKMPITREEFEQIILPRVVEVKDVVIKTLQKANLQPEQIDQVVRTGGSSLIPAIEQMLADVFNQEKITIFETFTSIAAGLVLE